MKAFRDPTAPTPREATSPPGPTRPGVAGGFTLVELLTVIAVLGILAALLAPALVRAMHGARASRCLSHLRQLGVAAQLYWDDHDGATFRYRTGVTNDGVSYWFGWLENGPEGRRTFDPRAGSLWPYLQARGVEVCPAFRPPPSDFKPKAAGGAYGYGYNLALSAPEGQPSIRPQSTPRPSELTVFADAAQVNDFQPPASPDHPMLEEFFYVNTSEPTAHFRHLDRSQVLFSDLHAARENPAPGTLDLRLPSARVGRLRPEILRLP